MFQNQGKNNNVPFYLLDLNFLLESRKVDYCND